MILTRDFDLGYRAISREIEMLPDRASGGPGPGGLFRVGRYDTAVNKSKLSPTRYPAMGDPKTKKRSKRVSKTSNV